MIFRIIYPCLKKIRRIISRNGIEVQDFYTFMASEGDSFKQWTEKKKIEKFGASLQLSSGPTTVFSFFKKIY